MINYDKLNGAIVTKTTLTRMINDENVSEVKRVGQTVWLDKWKIITNHGSYMVYTRGGIISALILSLLCRLEMR